MIQKDYRFELKTLSEKGTFEGYLSVFDVVDLVNDVVEPGAFKKTIQERGGVVPMLWQHDTKQPIGTLEISEDEHGLKVLGKLVMDVERAREAYALLKAEVIRGLSIGFEPVKKRVEKGIRYLKEIRLYEGSVVTFPALPLAQVTVVKADEQKEDFAAELQRMQVFAMRSQMLNALYYSLDSQLYDGDDMDAADIITASEESIDQFRSAYIEHLPKLLDMWGVKELPERKAGRRISTATRAQISEAIAKLQALLEEDQGTSDEDEAAEAAAKEAAARGKSHTPTEPEQFHSLLAAYTKTIKENLSWN